MRRLKHASLVLGLVIAAVMWAGCSKKPGTSPASGAASQPGSRPAIVFKAYTAWPFDAKEAARRQDETGYALGVSKEFTLALGGKVTMKLVLIPAGKFMMGSPENEKGRFDNEDPQHDVEISSPFYIGVYEVTQEQWQAVMGTTPWKDRYQAIDEATNAASYISWYDAAAFCEKLAMKTGRRVSLPTEAQWEYACRAGTRTRFFYGDDDDCSKLGDYAWYQQRLEDHQYPHAAGQKRPNAFGLYDMCGNVWEWCADWYADSRAGAKNIDPQGPASGTSRVVRGGSFQDIGAGCRSSFRAGEGPALGGKLCGFRVVVRSN